MPKRLTTAEFLSRALKIHGTRFDYSKVVYKTSGDKIIIVCRRHGKFTQTPSNHIGHGGQGCPDCKFEKLRKRFQLTTKEFIDKARAVHGDKYSYDKVRYRNSPTKVIITCRKHGDFEQSAGRHMRGQGCPSCGTEDSHRLSRFTTQQFITKARMVHGTQYDYRKARYIKTSTKVIITCRKHGDFTKTANKHLHCGQGCPDCSLEKRGYSRRITHDNFIARAIEMHGNRYDYSKAEYIHAGVKVVITCRKHGDFRQQAHSHLLGNGCRKCSGNIRLTTAEFVAKAREVHGRRYDYSKTVYGKNTTDRVTITCHKHGDFKKKPSSHLQGAGCPYCRKSFGETIIRVFLKANKIKFASEYRIPECRNSCPLPFDFAVWTGGRLHLIEYHGQQHYEPFSRFGGYRAFKTLRHRDRIKRDFCRKHRIPLLVIPYTERNIKPVLLAWLQAAKAATPHWQAQRTALTIRLYRAGRSLTDISRAVFPYAKRGTCLNKTRAILKTARVWQDGI
jgi:hypothetical protein